MGHRLTHPGLGSHTDFEGSEHRVTTMESCRRSDSGNPAHEIHVGTVIHTAAAEDHSEVWVNNVYLAWIVQNAKSVNQCPVRRCERWVGKGKKLSDQYASLAAACRVSQGSSWEKPS
jgi:hypothetical protein